MNARMAPLSRSWPSDDTPGVGASRTLARLRGAEPWRRVWPSLGAVLAIALPAFGFDADAQEPQAAQHFVLDSSGVPTSANWVVLDARGIAAWRAEGDTRWHSFTRGEVLTPGTEIETGADGEITLVAGGDQLTIAPQGRLIVPVAQPGQDRRLRHERGRIMMQIESRDARDVRVNTPLLSLGIKGTTFEVLVEPDQDSVLVHEGDVEVMTPGATEPVDLGPNQGLRQPAVPDSAPSRFELPAPEGTAGSADAPAWRLEPAPRDRAGAQEIQGPPRPPEAATTRSQLERTHDSARAKPASSERRFDLRRLDELAMSWGNIAMVAVGLILLTIPALVLLQHLREQWLGRPRPKGERRRQLVRG